MKTGVDLIKEEREKQIEVWGAEHDSKYTKGELLEAAVCYLGTGKLTTKVVDEKEAKELFGIFWPWKADEFHPTFSTADLVKAAALICSEIDRRLGVKDPEKNEVSRREAYKAADILGETETHS